jgi:DNA (cytosine-5)-methyltransferase 1
LFCLGIRTFADKASLAVNQFSGYVMAPTYVDLFSGCGGISLGFRDAGFRCLLAADSDPQAVKVYNRNFSTVDPPVAEVVNLSTLDNHDKVAAFLASRGIRSGECDVLVGGPPCQSFSVVGRNKIRALVQSDGDLEVYWAEKNRIRTTLFEVYARFLEVLAPRWFLFENVPSIRSHPGFPDIATRFATLRAPNGNHLDYRLHEGIYLASKYGVPQDRRRFLLVGRRADITSEWVAPPSNPGPTVGAALGDLPPVPNGHRVLSIKYDRSPQNAYQRLMRARLPENEQFVITHHICRRHNSDDVQLFDRMVPGARFADPEVQAAIVEINPQHKLRKYAVDKFSDKLHRLDPKRAAWTVTAHLQKDCYKFIHPWEPRTITVREAARLQSFPDRFTFSDVAMGPAFRMIGNAVPPLLAQAFAESFIACDAELASRRRQTQQAQLSEEEWMRLAPLLSPEPQRRVRGRPKLRSRDVIEGILFVQRAGISFEMLPASRGYGSGLTCRQRYYEWRKEGRWDQIQQRLCESWKSNDPTVYESQAAD